MMKSAAQKAEPVKPPEHKPLLAKTDAVKADAGQAGGADQARSQRKW